jgi:hypothetical protein
MELKMKLKMTKLATMAASALGALVVTASLSGAASANPYWGYGYGANYGYAQQGYGYGNGYGYNGGGYGYRRANAGWDRGYGRAYSGNWNNGWNGRGYYGGNYGYRQDMERFPTVYNGRPQVNRGRQELGVDFSPIGPALGSATTGALTSWGVPAPVANWAGGRINANTQAAGREYGLPEAAVRIGTGISMRDIQERGILGGDNSEARKACNALAGLLGGRC